MTYAGLSYTRDDRYERMRSVKILANWQDVYDLKVVHREVCVESERNKKLCKQTVAQYDVFGKLRASYYPTYS